MFATDTTGAPHTHTASHKRHCHISSVAAAPALLTPAAVAAPTHPSLITSIIPSTIASHSLSTPVALSARGTLCVLAADTLCRLFDRTDKPSSSSSSSSSSSPSRFLFDTPAGDIQRHLDADHLHELVEYQDTHLRAHRHCSFPTNVVVAEFEGRIALVDGQHRIETMRYLRRKGSMDAEQWASLRVPVVTIRLNAPSEYDGVFVAINKNKPVQLYSNVDAWKSVLKGVEQHFRVHYGAYIREKSDRPRVPHINVQALLRYLDEGDYVRKLGLSCEAFVSEIEELNTCYRLHWRQLVPKKYVKEIAEWAPRCIAKQPTRPLMLGIYQTFEWVDRILLKVNHPDAYPSYETMVHSTRNPRVRIPIATRQLVWNKRNPMTIGLIGACYVCDRALNYNDMQCGHVVSVFAGGATVLSNLEPICGCCNRDMGIEELGGYRGRVRGDGVSF